MYKRIHWILAALLGLFSPALFALGLGGAVVKSYLDQPLDVRIELISKTSGELESLTAGLASADDFELLGLSRAAISVPLKFELVTDTAQPYIHVTSDLSINEPVVQVLVEVVWASGRMLREYTLFLDPPTFASQAPPVVVKPASRPALPPIESATPPAVPVQRTSKPAAPQPAPEEPVIEEPVIEEPAQNTQPETSQAGQQISHQSADEEIYGPVARGETLWGIARDFSKGSGYSVNQVMIAMQRKNPEAFIRGNINSLKRGAILRMPAFSEIGELTSREAMLEAMRQGQEARAGSRSVAPDFSTPTVADSGDYQESVTDQAPETGLEEDSGHLELVPPAEDQPEEPGEETSPPEQLPVAGTPDDAILEHLSRTEEELVNAQQENSYLTQRIQELEAEVAARSDPSIGVEDSGLASLESNLAAERASDEPETPVAITPGGESQAWYAGKNGFIAGFAIVLITLIVWVLLRRSAAKLDKESSGESTGKSSGKSSGESTGKSAGKSAGKLTGKSAGESGVVVPAFAVVAKKIMQAPDRAEDEGETVAQMLWEPDEAALQTAEMDEDKTVVQLMPDFAPTYPTASGSDIQFADDDDLSVDDDTSEEDDPEIKLDLARAYLSLGDIEASKSMLDEVLKSGNEKQKAEALQMMGEL